MLDSSANADAPPAVNAPVALTDQGLSLTTNYAPMGSMTLSGTPSQAYTQSPGPLEENVEFSAALRHDFGAIKALEQGQLGWWQDLAPGLQPAVPLMHATVTGYASSLDVTVDRDRERAPTGVEFHTDFYLKGGFVSGSGTTLMVAFVVSQRQTHHLLLDHGSYLRTCRVVCQYSVVCMIDGTPYALTSTNTVVLVFNDAVPGMRMSWAPLSTCSPHVGS